MANARALTYAAGALSAKASIYRGFTIRETAGAAAVVRLWDNAAAAAGTLLATIALTANQSKDFDNHMGVWAANGVFAETVSGAVEGSVFVG